MDNCNHILKVFQDNIKMKEYNPPDPEEEQIEIVEKKKPKKTKEQLFQIPKSNKNMNVY